MDSVSFVFFVAKHLSNCGGTSFAGPYSDTFVHRQDENLSIADIARARAFYYGVDCLFDIVVVHGNGKPHLLVQRHFLNRTTVQMQIAALLSAS